MRRQSWVQPSQPFRSVVPVRLECELESGSELVSQVTSLYRLGPETCPSTKSSASQGPGRGPQVPSATGAHPGAFQGSDPYLTVCTESHGVLPPALHT